MTVVTGPNGAKVGNIISSYRRQMTWKSFSGSFGFLAY